MELERSSWADGSLPLGPSGAKAAIGTAFALHDALWRGPVGIALFDEELRFVAVNDALSRIDGLSPDAHVGRALGELLRSGDGDPALREVAPRVEAVMRAVLASGCPVTGYAIPGRLPDGTPREWDCSWFPVVGPDGAPRGVCALTMDATDRGVRHSGVERARAAAERCTARVTVLQEVTAALSIARTVEDVASVFVLQVHDAFEVDGAAVYALDAAAGTLRLVASAGIGDDARACCSLLPLGTSGPSAEAARTGTAVWIETRERLESRYPGLLARVAGTDRLSAVAALPLRSGGAVRGVATLVFHAPRAFGGSDRALLENVAVQCAQAFERAQLFDAEHAARADAERARGVLDAVLDNAPVGIAVVDRELRFQRVNAVLAEMHGIAAEAHLGRTMRELLPALPIDDVEASWRRVLETGVPLLDVEISGETPAAPGKRQHWLQSWYPVRARGEIVGLGALVREITAEAEAQEFQRNVLAIVGHELRNPLSVVSNGAHLLGARAAANPTEVTRLGARIEAASRRMARIVGLLLDYARAQTRRAIPLRPAPADVGALCAAAVEEARATHGHRDVRLSGRGDPAVEWDADRVAQVLSNLLGNALRHGVPDAPVDLSWQGERDAVTIEVANVGAPIPPDLLPRLFEPFQRAAGEGGEGLGLGLFIARSIVSAHHGTIDARSGADGRTVFRVRLPHSAR